MLCNLFTSLNKGSFLISWYKVFLGGLSKDVQGEEQHVDGGEKVESHSQFSNVWLRKRIHQTDRTKQDKAQKDLKGIHVGKK